MPRSIRLAVLFAAVAGSIAVIPASASALTLTNPTTLDFGSQPVGVPSPAKGVSLIVDCDSVTVPPLCTLPVIFVPSVSVTGDFSQTNGCVAPLTAIAGPVSCPITVTFTPTSTGTRSGTLSTGGPVVPLTGVGVTSTGGGGSTAPSGPSGAKKKCKKKHRSFATSAKKKKCKKRHRR